MTTTYAIDAHLKVFLKYGPNPDVFLVYFGSFQNTILIGKVHDLIINGKTLVVIRTRNCRMVGADESTELPMSGPHSLIQKNIFLI